MNFLRKYGYLLLLGITLTIIFFASRIYNLGVLPIFTDEALYVRWAQIAKNDPQWRFISLTDGKQPMFIWAEMVAMRFIQDPLVAGRMTSVFAGFLTSIGLFFLAKALFKNKWIGIITSFLYILYPFALVYDRLAIYDSLVATFAIWSVFFIVLLVRTLRLDVAIILGMILGGGALNKTTGFISAYLMPIGILLFDFAKKGRNQGLFRFFLLGAISVALMYLYYSILRLSPFYHIINEKNTIFFYPLTEWLKHPFNFFVGNILGLWDWLLNYAKWPWIILMGASLVIDKKYIREKIFLILWFFVPFAIMALIGKVLYPRFIFFMTLFLLPLAAYSLYQIKLKIKNGMLLGFCFLLFSFMSLRSDFFILTDFAHAPIPQSDLGQLINNWPAGGGIKETVAFLQNESKKGKIHVATQGTFGLLPAALEIYLWQNSDIELKGYWPIDDDPPKDLVEKSKEMPTFLVFYQPCPSCPIAGEVPKTWKKATLVTHFQKGIGPAYLSIYRLVP